MKHKIEKNKHYKIKINIFGRILEYEGKIIEIKSPNFYIKTENNCKLEHKIKNIITAEEITQKNEQKVHKISNKKKYTNLKPIIEPDL